MNVRDEYATYDEYIALSPWWHAYRLREIKNVCCACDKKGNPEFMVLHHVTYARVGRELPEDTVTLCKWCHTQVAKLIWKGFATLRDAHWMIRDEQMKYHAQMELFARSVVPLLQSQVDDDLDHQYDDRMDDEAA